MNKTQLHPQYLTDEKGNKTSVLLPIDEFLDLVEDLEDLAVLAKRKDEPVVSFNSVVNELGIQDIV